MCTFTYLHDVLDLWAEKVVRPKLKGEFYMVRYADGWTDPPGCYAGRWGWVNAQTPTAGIPFPFSLQSGR